MAPSKESQALADFFKILSVSNPTGDIYLQRCLYDQVHTLATEASGVRNASNALLHLSSTDCDLRDRSATKALQRADDLEYG